MYYILEGVYEIPKFQDEAAAFTAFKTLMLAGVNVLHPGTIEIILFQIRLEK